MVPHDELLAAVWRATFDQGGSAAQVRSTVGRLRKKLAATTGGACRIASVRGVGYRLQLFPAAPNARPSAAAQRRWMLIAMGLVALLVGGWLFWQHLPGDPRTPIWYRGRQVPAGVLWLTQRGQNCCQAPDGGLYCFDSRTELAAALGLDLPGIDAEEAQRLREAGAVPDLRPEP